MTIEISLEADKGGLLYVTLEPCNKTLESSRKTRDVGGTQASMNRDKKMYWIYVAVGISDLSLIIIVIVRACRKKKEEKKVVTDENVVYGAEEYFYQEYNFSDENADLILPSRLRSIEYFLNTLDQQPSDLCYAQ